MAQTTPLLTPAELGEQIRRSVRTLERWRRDGTGPRFVGGGAGRPVGYRQTDVDAWLDAQARSSTSEVAP